MGFAQDLGSIEPGKLADLVVLNKNPLDDIHNTNTIQYVMKNGELFEGDTLYADSEVLDARESKSRKGWGIVKVRQRGFKPDGTVVLVMIRSFMVPTRATAPRREPPSPRD